MRALVARPHVNLRALARNEPVLAGAVMGFGGRTSLAALVEPGYRAVSVQSGEVAGVAGFILPGDAVDVLLTRATPGGALTQIVAGNIQVLAVDQSDDPVAARATPARTVTLEVSPEDAESIALARSLGTVSLALRGPGDRAVARRRVTMARDLGVFEVVRAAPSARPARSAAASGSEVRVTRGLEPTVYTVGP